MDTQEMRCPHCDYVASGGTEQEMKDRLRQHFLEAHRIAGADFESMYSEMKMAATLFEPPAARTR